MERPSHIPVASNSRRFKNALIPVSLLRWIQQAYNALHNIRIVADGEDVGTITHGDSGTIVDLSGISSGGTTVTQVGITADEIMAGTVWMFCAADGSGGIGGWYPAGTTQAEAYDNLIERGYALAPLETA